MLSWFFAIALFMYNCITGFTVIVKEKLAIDSYTGLSGPPLIHLDHYIGAICLAHCWACNACLDEAVYIYNVSSFFNKCPILSALYYCLSQFWSLDLMDAMRSTCLVCAHYKYDVCKYIVLSPFNNNGVSIDRLFLLVAYCQVNGCRKSPIKSESKKCSSFS